MSPPPPINKLLGLIYYNYRYYHPADGRWTGRDRIEEQDDQNIYRFSSNNSVSVHDILGLWKATKESSSKARRVYISEEKDTKEELAKLVQLDVNEFNQWAKPESKNKHASELFCRYSVPNVWIAADFLRGGHIINRIVNLGGTIGVWVGTDIFTSNNRKVIKPKTRSALLNSINRDTWGFVVYGHGGDNNDYIFNGRGDPEVRQTELRDKVSALGYINWQRLI